MVVWQKRTKVLIEQTYSEADDIAHFYRMLPAFRDRRYICVDGKPLVFIHQGLDLPEHTIRIWNRLAKENGLDGIHFVGRIRTAKNCQKAKEILLHRGFDAVTVARLGASSILETIFQKIIRKSWQFFRYNGCCHLISYRKELKTLCDPLFDASDDVYPGLYPNWDHSPRSGRNGFIIVGSTPELFRVHVNQVLDTVSRKQMEHRVVFVKSWNEWGEGNYLEPDQKFGKGYLNVLAETLVKEP